MEKRMHYRSLAWDVLKAIGAGAAIASLFVAPNIGLALKPFLRDSPAGRRRWERRRVQEALRRLHQRRCIRFEQRGNATYLIITEPGRQRLQQFEFDALSLPERPSRWDGKWRIAIFDIPERRKRERHALRSKLDALGFLALQKSVFVYPYPCEDELDFLCQFLDVDRYTHCIEARTLGSAEGRVRRHFGLL